MDYKLPTQLLINTFLLSLSEFCWRDERTQEHRFQKLRECRESILYVNFSLDSMKTTQALWFSLMMEGKRVSRLAKMIEVASMH